MPRRIRRAGCFRLLLGAVNAQIHALRLLSPPRGPRTHASG